jgi:hypothetical protein
MWIVGGGGPFPGGIYGLDRTGALSTVRLLTILDAGDVDDAGRLIGHELNASNTTILSISQLGAITSLVAYPPNLVLGPIAVDPYGGGILASDGTNILRLSANPPASVTTIVTSLRISPSLHYSPETDGFVGSDTNDLIGFSARVPHIATTLLDPPLSLGRPWWAVPIPGSSQLLLAFLGVTGPSAVMSFDATAKAITTIHVSSFNVSPFAVHVAHSRHLVGTTPPQRGSNYSMLVSFPRYPGRPYIVALSLGLTAGYPVGGSRGYLAHDALFFVSLTAAGIFSRLQGTLGATGEAKATIPIPAPASLAGTVLFATAIAVDRSRVAVSSPLGFRVQ